MMRTIKRQHERKAFTLIELLVVLAITAVLITLVAIPLVQGFKLTRTGQAFVEAQYRARQLAERIRKEMSTAAGVLDNSIPAAAVEISLPIRNATTQAFAGYANVYLSQAKVDIVPAAKGDPGLIGPGGGLINPNIGKEDPTLRAPIGQIRLPLAPGLTIVRYWVGLRNPFGNYVNPWQPVITGAQVGDENLYVLRRAEVAPYVWDPQLGRYVANTAFFAVDEFGNPIINDPGFFTREPQVLIDDLPSHQQRLQNWVNASTIVSHDIRDDFIIPSVDEATGNAVYDPYAGNTEIPRVRSLVAFMPVKISNEPATGNFVARAGVEITDADTRHAPEYFETENIGWSKDSLVRVFRSDTLSPYFVTRYRQVFGSAVFDPFVLETVLFDPLVDVDEYNDGFLVFDLEGYLASIQSGFPSIGAHLMNGFGNTELVLSTVDYKRGRVIMSFPVEHAIGNTPTETTENINAMLTGWQNSTTANSQPGLKEYGRRFFNLKTAPPNGANDFNPMGTTARGWLLDAHIVPGSEKVIGPDQAPGPNFGRPIRYTRVANSQRPGPNQYKINYVDMQEPSWSQLNLPDPNVNSDVATYILPQFQKGYVEFNSDPNVPLPAGGNISVSYLFQMNEIADSVTVDYDSAQQMQIEVVVRRFPGSGGDIRPIAVTVKEVVSVRNFVR